MPVQRSIVIVSLLSALGMISSIAIAAENHQNEHEHRQHSAHVHGLAALNMALEGNEIQIELTSPAANIVGFEHEPNSEEDHTALLSAVDRLRQGDVLFRFNPEADCAMEVAEIESSLLEHEDEHGHEHEQEAEHDDRHGHDEHEEEGETHSEISAFYHFECSNPQNINRLSVELFDAFKATQQLKLQYIIENHQGAAELTPSNHSINF